MAKFIEVTQKSSKISDKYFSVLVNIDKIQCAVTALGEGDDRLTSIFFNSAEDDGLPLIKESPSEIHALIKEAQNEDIEVEIEQDDLLEKINAAIGDEEDQEPDDLSQLTPEQKEEHFNR